VPPGSGVVDGSASGDGVSIVELTLSAETLRVGDSLLISALVAAEPEIVIAGGQVVDPSSGALYSNLTQDGATVFSATLTWDQLNDMDPIYSDSGSVLRELKVRVFTNAGGEASLNFRVELGCQNSAHALCAGDCVDLSSDSRHCGACHQALAGDQLCNLGQQTCPAERPISCEDGSCVVSSQTSCGSCGHNCYDVWEGVPQNSDMPYCIDGGCVGGGGTDQRVSCADLCGSAGFSCYQGAAGDWELLGRAMYQDGSGYNLTSCNDTPAETYNDEPFFGVNCFCTD